MSERPSRLRSPLALAPTGAALIPCPSMSVSDSALAFSAARRGRDLERSRKVLNYLQRVCRRPVKLTTTRQASLAPGTDRIFYWRTNRSGRFRAGPDRAAGISSRGPGNGATRQHGGYVPRGKGGFKANGTYLR